MPKMFSSVRLGSPSNGVKWLYQGHEVRARIKVPHPKCCKYMTTVGTQGCRLCTSIHTTCTSRQPGSLTLRLTQIMFCWSSLCLLPELLWASPLFSSLSSRIGLVYITGISKHYKRNIMQGGGVSWMFSLCQSTSAKELYPWLIPKRH